MHAEGKSAFEVGERVRARSPEDQEWYAGSVAEAIRAGGKVTVRWDDPNEGVECATVDASNVKKVSVYKDYAVGDDVMAVFQEDGQLYPAIVEAVRDDGSFSVRWDEADEGGAAVSDLQVWELQKMVVRRDYKVGDEVRIKMPGDPRPTFPFPGRVVQAFEDGAYQVQWLMTDERGDEVPQQTKCRAKEMIHPPIPFDELQIGQKRHGYVANLLEFGAFVDIGAESCGLLHISSLSTELVDNIYEHLYVGKEVDVWISGVRDGGKFGVSMVEGKISGMGPRGQIRTRVDLSKIPQAEFYPGVVTTIKPVGAFVTVHLPGSQAFDCFLHISQVRKGHIDDIQKELRIGQEVQVRIQPRLNKQGKIVVSMLEFEEKPPQEQVNYACFAELPPDRFLTGKVKSLSKHGAMVQLQAPDSNLPALGFLHIKQISTGFVRQIEDELWIGQQISVRVQTVDRDARKMTLSMLSLVAEVQEDERQLVEGQTRKAIDWAFFDQLPYDEWLTATVKRIYQYGATVEVEVPGSDKVAQASLHVSQVREDAFVEDIRTELQQGQRIKVRVKEVDAEKGYMKVTMKSPQDRPAQPPLEAEEEEVEVADFVRGRARSAPKV